MQCILISSVIVFFSIQPTSPHLIVKEFPLYDKYFNKSYVNKNNFRRNDGLVYEGIFPSFIYDLLTLLIEDFPEKRMPKYFKTLNRNLREMPYKYAKKLGKYCLELAKDKTGKDELPGLKAQLNKEMPERREFITELNQYYTMQQGVRFRDYIMDLRDYGNRDILFIEEETRKLLFDHILKPIERRSSWQLVSLEKKLKKAVKEYEELSSDDFKEIYQMLLEHKEQDKKGLSRKANAVLNLSNVLIKL